MKPRLAVIGPGRLGQAIAARLRLHGYPVSAIVGRDLQRTRCAARFIGAEWMATTDLRRCSNAQLILLTVGDDQLAATAAQLQRTTTLDSEVLLVHCSGLHPASLLAGDSLRPEQLLSMHPLQTFASAPQGLASLPGTFFALEGAAPAIAAGQQLVADLGGEAFTIAAHTKVLYHAAACIACNFTTTLIATAAQLLADCRIDLSEPAPPTQALGPLLRTTLENSLALGPEAALTGPIVRGDSGTVARHLEQLQHQHPPLAELYRQLAVQTLHLAQNSQRLTGNSAARMAQLLKNAGHDPCVETA